MPTTAACPAFARTADGACACGAAPARCRCGLLRQDQSRPVRLRPQRHALALRRGAQQLRRALRLGRLQFGLGLCGGHRPGRLRAGHRHGRLRPRAGRPQQHRRHQALARACSARAAWCRRRRAWTACRSSRARSAIAARVLQAAMGFDAGRPLLAPRSRSTTQPLPAALSLRRAVALQFFGDDASAAGLRRRRIARLRGARRHAVADRLRAAGRRPPRCSTTARWWPSATPPCASSSTRTRPR